MSPDAAHVWIARQDGREAGRVCLTAGSGVATLHGLVVDAPGAKGQIACHLIEAAAEYARERGCLEIVVDLDRKMERLGILLRCIGFLPDGDVRARRYYLDLYRRQRAQDCAARVASAAIGLEIEYRPPEADPGSADLNEDIP